MKDTYIKFISVFFYLPLAGLCIWFLYSKGQASIQEEWDKEKAHTEQILKEVESKYAELLEEHIQFSSLVATTLEDKDKQYEESIISIRSDFVGRLRQHEARVQMYERQAQAGSVEASSLASHATELDRNLEQSIRSIEELAATVRLRDEQLILLGSQIKADRAILESN